VNDQPTPGQRSAVGALPSDSGGRPLPSAVTGWVQAGTLDVELAALVTVLLEHGLPLVVAAPAKAFAGGWSGRDVRDRLGRMLVACAAPTVLGTRLAAPLDVDGASLEAVLSRLPELTPGAAGEAGTRLAMVLVLEPDPMTDTWLTSAAHLLRPALRDGHGHLQHQGPAVLATWDPLGRRYEHFAWGVLPELAGPLGIRSGDLDAERAARQDLLAGMLSHDIDDPGEIRRAIVAARTALALVSMPPPGHHH
jgi:hypothetical protein